MSVYLMSCFSPIVVKISLLFNISGWNFHRIFLTVEKEAI
jgi:hypothetical protein